MQLHEYQKKIVNFLQAHQKAVVSVDMGLGKTISVLTYLQQTKPATALIIAPKRVAETVWLQEAQKWNLTIANLFTICKGTKIQRNKAFADHSKPYKIISRENIKDIPQNITWGVLILDELTSYKNIKSKRTEAVIQIKAHQYIGLTGTFLANGAIDIFGQLAACHLNVWQMNFYQWRATYFRDVLQGSGLAFSKWKPTKELKEILKPVQEYIFTLSAADYLNIPPKTEQIISCQLSEQTQKNIKELDAFLCTEINGETIAIHDKQKFAKLQTLCNGFVYDTQGNSIRAAKSDKLEYIVELIEELVEQGEHILLFYAYRDEALWLFDMLQAKKIRCQSVAAPNFLKNWNDGRTDVLFAHPASAGHGLNLQHGGRVIIWSTLTYNYELFAQGNARLARQGQDRNVLIYYCIAENTVEERIIKALQNKDTEQQKFVNLTKQ